METTYTEKFLVVAVLGAVALIGVLTYTTKGAQEPVTDAKAKAGYAS
jgi:hypothetical protein